MVGAITESTPSTQKRLLEEILAAVTVLPDAPVRAVIPGSHFLAVVSLRMGICSNIRPYGPHGGEEDDRIPESARQLASFLLNPPPDLVDAPAYGLAAINSLLPVPKGAVSMKAQDLIREKGQGRNVAVVGHFPFVGTLGDGFRNFWVLESRPKKGDFPAEAAPELLPQADVIALTATTLLNGTCAELLEHIHKGAFTIILGPSTPFAPCLFDWAIGALAGCRVTDESLAAVCLREGLPFKPSMGVEPLIWMKQTR